jgi:hypothetical protein
MRWGRGRAAWFPAVFTVAGNTDTVSGNGLEISEKNGVPAWAFISAGYQLLLSPLLPWIAGSFLYTLKSKRN